MSEASDRSDVSRSARGHVAGAPTERRTSAGDGRRFNSAHGRAAGSSGTLLAPAPLSLPVNHVKQQQNNVIHSNLSEDRFVSSNTQLLDASWEETQSFDESEERGRPSSRSVNSSNVRDRRKQFDATTPTLIDEDDDSEIVSLDHSRIQFNGAYDKDEAVIRRTPGASMYKSTFESTIEEGSNMRKSPVASAINRSAGRPQSMPSPYQQHLGNQNVPVGLGFGIPLSASVGTLEPSELRQSHLDWENPYGQNHIADRARSQQSLKQISRSSLSDDVASSVRSGHLEHVRNPFTFASWTKGGRDLQNHQLQQSREDSRLGSGGAFSPNILRLTEDIGNLLHEDEDDDFALEIPSVFRGAQVSDVGSSNEDWTGSYVFDSEAGRRASRPAVPSRSSNPNANYAVAPREGKSRRRTSNANSLNQQSYLSSGFLPNAQQPKPRIRHLNEVFEFGKSSHIETSQALNFGGAFAPPSALMGPIPGSSHPMLATPFQVGGTMHASHNVRAHHHHNLLGHDPSLGLHTGTFHTAIRDQHGTLTSSQPPAFYQQNRNLAVDCGAPYVQPHSLIFPPFSDSQSFGATSSTAYPTQHSEMHASAREFVPRNAYPGFQNASFESEWQSNAAETTNWPDTSYGAAMGYRMSHEQIFGDHRSNLDPSPQVPLWTQTQHQLLIQQPLVAHSSINQHQHSLMQTPPPGIDSNISNNRTPETGRTLESENQATSAIACRATSSPHPSVAGSEHSQSTSQKSKKESKRKQRGKKKTVKAESPSSTSKPLSSTKKTKGKMEQSRQSLASHISDGIEDTQASASEDPNEAKRSELIESPATRAAFKEFYRAIRSEERVSFQNAENFALQSLADGSLPESVHWRVYLELADLAKRSNRYFEARRLYKMVCQLQPFASQGWLEYSKLEEECGHMNRVMNILHSGLEYCEYSESLLTRAVKHQEKMGNLATARELLARLKHIGIEKVWRTVLEGALLEARAGNVSTARRVLKYLMHHVPWYGPLYLEAYRLEKDQGHPLDALQIVERGLQAIPRYGPLWFGAFRLCEDVDRTNKRYHLPQTLDMIERATLSISKELVWKVHLEAAQMLERSAFENENVENLKSESLLISARRRLAMTILTCPNNLRWKVWLASARMELGTGKADCARALFLRAHEVVPKKGRSSTLLETARLEDFIGDTNLARAILCRGRVIYGHDWKVWLESVLLEIRSGSVARAVDICTNALQIHHGTGRLWATLVQLRQYTGRDEAQQCALRQALNAVPKSGEVWCEGGRIHLNPFSDTFDLERARRHLYFATRFTPQYGDGFVETIRLELIEQWLAPIAKFVWENTKSSFQPSNDDGTDNSLTKYVTDVALAISVASSKDNAEDMSMNSLPKLVHRNIVSEVRNMLKPKALQSNIDLSELRRACVNADPNYGLLWFHCRRRPTDTPRRIIEDAAGDVAAELQKHAHIYLAAMVRRLAIVSTAESQKPCNVQEGLEITNQESAKWNDLIDEKLKAAPSLEEIFNPIDPTTGLVLLENTVSGPLFVTGLSELNKHRPISSLSLSERRRSLFGNDALFP